MAPGSSPIPESRTISLIRSPPVLRGGDGRGQSHTLAFNYVPTPRCTPLLNSEPGLTKISAIGIVDEDGQSQERHDRAGEPRRLSELDKATLDEATVAVNYPE